jgi:hypothetical protein
MKRNPTFSATRIEDTLSASAWIRTTSTPRTSKA